MYERENIIYIEAAQLVGDGTTAAEVDQQLHAWIDQPSAPTERLHLESDPIAIIDQSFRELPVYAAKYPERERLTKRIAAWGLVLFAGATAFKSGKKHEQ